MNTISAFLFKSNVLLLTVVYWNRSFPLKDVLLLEQSLNLLFVLYACSGKILLGYNNGHTLFCRFHYSFRE